MEDEVKSAFIKSLNGLLGNRNELLENVKTICDTLSDTSSLEEERDKCADEMSEIADMVQNAMYENARVAIDQNAYREKNEILTARFENAKKKHEELSKQIEEIHTREQNLRHFYETLENVKGVVTEFDSSLWSALVNYITVFDNGETIVTYKDGSEI